MGALLGVHKHAHAADYVSKIVDCFDFFSNGTVLYHAEGALLSLCHHLKPEHVQRLADMADVVMRDHVARTHELRFYESTLTDGADYIHNANSSLRRINSTLTAIGCFDPQLINPHIGTMVRCSNLMHEADLKRASAEINRLREDVSRCRASNDDYDDDGPYYSSPYTQG